MSTTSDAEELDRSAGFGGRGAPGVHRGAAHLTIRADGSMEDLYRARFEGKVPDVRVDGGTVVVTYRMGLRPLAVRSCFPGRVPG